MGAKEELSAISSLASDALSQFVKLFQNEVDLAKAEIGEKVEQAGRGAAFLAAGAMLALPAVIMLLFAFSAALIAYGWSPALAYLASAILSLAIAGLLTMVGINKIKAGGLMPQVTIRQLEKDKDTLKGLVR